ncbi:MAG TPA: tetratricopeptide repeat protein [Fimbriimonadaceae bacterium]|nr:tetratricopeptide repeat protein [Fimbriimonadaceae bacterium]HRJ96126.1 tetratricopeptide repeat protein [Fimbriimonadaceae bacterium]
MAQAGSSREDEIARWIALAEDEADPTARVAVYDQAIGSVRPGEVRLASLHLNRSLALCELSRYEAALEDLRKAGSLDMSTPLVPLARGAILAKMGRLEEALPYFDRAIERDPNLIEAHHNRGLALMELGRTTEAVRALERGLELEPTSRELRFAHGLVLARSGWFAEALTTFEGLLASDDRLTYYLTGLSQLALGHFNDAAESLSRAEQTTESPHFFRSLGHALRGGRDPEAADVYSRALQLDPHDADSVTGLAACSFIGGDFEEALSILQKSDSGREMLILESAAYLALGLDEAALESATSAATFDENFAHPFGWRARVLWTFDRTDDALQDCETALRLDPDCALALGCRADIHRFAGRLDEALVDADRLVSLRPGDPEAHLRRARILQKAKRYDEALKAINQTVNLDAMNARAHNLHGNVLANMSKTDDAIKAYERAIRCDSQYAAPHIGRGAMLARKGRKKQSCEEFQRAAELDPNDPYAPFQLGRTLHQLDRHAEAEPHLRRSLELDPENAKARLALAEVLQALGRSDDAVVEAQQAYALDPELMSEGTPIVPKPPDSEDYFHRAEEAAKTGQSNEALHLLGIAIQLATDNAEYPIAKAELLNRVGRWKEALEEARRALSLDSSGGRVRERYSTLMKTIEMDRIRCVNEAPASIPALLDLVAVQVERGRFSAAEDACLKALENDPMSIPALHALAEVLERAGDPEGALEAYERAEAIDPVRGEITRTGELRAKVASATDLIYLAERLFESREPKRALTAVRQALDVLPRSAEAHLLRANIHYALGHLDEAMNAFDTVVRLEPGWAEAHLLRGNMLYQLERYDEALDAYERAIRLDPSLQMARKNRDALVMALSQR